MKKVFSVLLCICLFMGTILVSIPAASAEVTNPERFPEMKKAELIYSEDFEGTDVTSASNKTALLKALGWIENQQFASAKIQQDSDSENHQLYLSPSYDSYMTICTDDRLAGGNYVIEYTATMLRFSASHDGAGMGFRSGYKEGTVGWNFLTKERGNFDFHFHTSEFEPGNRHSEVDIAPEIENVSGILRGNGSVVGEKIRFRLVIDAENGLHAYTVNPTTGEATLVVGMNEECVSSWAADSDALPGKVQIRAITSGTAYLVDDIQIWSNYKSNSIPKLIGCQTTSLQNDTYDIRFVAGITSADDPSMGFDIGYSFLQNGTTVSGNKTVYCEYLYETLSSNYGTDSVSAEKLGYEYLMVLTITDVPSDLAITYTVTPFIRSDGDSEPTQSKHTKEFLVDKEKTQSAPELFGGTLNSTKEYTTDYYRTLYTDVTRAEYDAYVALLEFYGFHLYDENEINGNVYETFTSEYIVLHAYYMAHNGTVTILTTDIENWTPYSKAPVADATVTQPSLMMMDMSYLTQTGGKNNGMGFVYTLEDGSYVIIDGGWETEAPMLYQYLVENNKRADGKILIRAWIITHPDLDHYGCFNALTADYADKVTLEYFVSQFDQGHITSGYVQEITAIYQNAEKYAGCQHIVPMAGQVMYFGTLRLEFYFTAEMYRGYTGTELSATSQTNESSLAFMADLGDINVFFTADVLGRSIDLLADYYGEALKCQYFQAPHHGLNGTAKFFNYLNCDYILMTTHDEATAQRLDSTHAHGKQSKLYHLVNATGINPQTDVFAAGEKDDVAGDELTIIPIRVSTDS